MKTDDRVMTEKLNEMIKDKLSQLIEEIADHHLVGKPAILATGMFFSAEKFLIEQINKIETTFKD